MVFVNASSAKADANNPSTTAAPPADTVRPFKLRAVTLYVAAATEVLELKLSPTGTSEQVVPVT